LAQGFSATDLSCVGWGCDRTATFAMAPKLSGQGAKKRTLNAMKCKAVGGNSIVRQVNKRGTGLKFNATSYDMISRFTGQTRIKYGPNPKMPGSKSFDRYKKYQNCKTVGDALKYCKPADLLWEYERGDLKVLGGPMSDKPACMNPDSKDPAIKILAKFRGPRGCSIAMDPAIRAKLSKLASAFGMDLDQLHEEAGKQCNSESADIQTQRVIANEMARRKLDSLKVTDKVADKAVHEVLQIWGFAENSNRLNVMPEGVTSVHSDTLGVLRMRDGTYRIFDPTTRYEHVTRLLCRWFTDNKGKDFPSDFAFTGININSNYAGRRHRDANNEGPSAIKAIGNFSGGKLSYFPKDVKVPGRCEVTELDPKESISLDISKSFTLFNGNNAHGVQPFEGNRFSLVFFTTSKFTKVLEKERDTLTRLGFVFPTPESMKRVMDFAKKTDLSRAR